MKTSAITLATALFASAALAAPVAAEDAPARNNVGDTAVHPLIYVIAASKKAEEGHVNAARELAAAENVGDAAVHPLIYVIAASKKAEEGHMNAARELAAAENAADAGLEPWRYSISAANKVSEDTLTAEELDKAHANDVILTIGVVKTFKSAAKENAYSDYVEAADPNEILGN